MERYSWRNSVSEATEMVGDSARIVGGIGTRVTDSLKPVMREYVRREMVQPVAKKLQDIITFRYRRRMRLL